MKIVMYGADICSDCVAAKARIARRADIALEMRDITASTETLKEFLRHRDHDPLFAPVIAEGRIGIPFFLLEGGARTLDADAFLGPEDGIEGGACAIDGKGC